MKRANKPALAPAAQTLFDAYASVLQNEQDFRPASRRHYLRDLQQFLAWCEAKDTEGREATHGWNVAELSTPLLTHYRAYL